MTMKLLPVKAPITWHKRLTEDRLQMALSDCKTWPRWLIVASDQSDVARMIIDNFDHVNKQSLGVLYGCVNWKVDADAAQGSWRLEE